MKKLIFIFLMLTAVVFGADRGRYNPSNVLDEPWKLKGSGAWWGVPEGTSATLDMSDGSKFWRIADNNNDAFRVFATSGDFISFDSTTGAPRVLFGDPGLGMSYLFQGNAGLLSLDVTNSLATGVSVLEVINDSGHRASMGIAGTNHAVVETSSVAYYSTGHGSTAFIINGNKPFTWWTEVGDTHFIGAYSKKMELTAVGELQLKEETLLMEGDATVWDDYVTPLGPNNWNGVANNPALTKLFDDGSSSQGVYAYVFSDGDESLITIQMPHKWKEGTTIYPHIHFMCTSDVSPADNFGIEYEYTWVDIGEDFAVNTTLSTIDISTGVNTDNMHQAGDITAAGIDGTGHTISSVLLCRIKRVAASGDNYAGGVAILDFDVHYEIDTVGSREMLSK
jgi:hypothetical protein